MGFSAPITGDMVKDLTFAIKSLAKTVNSMDYPTSMPRVSGKTPTIKTPDLEQMRLKEYKNYMSGLKKTDLTKSPIFKKIISSNVGLFFAKLSTQFKYQTERLFDSLKGVYNKFFGELFGDLYREVEPFVNVLKSSGDYLRKMLLEPLLKIFPKLMLGIGALISSPYIKIKKGIDNTSILQKTEKLVISEKKQEGLLKKIVKSLSTQWKERKSVIKTFDPEGKKTLKSTFKTYFGKKISPYKEAIERRFNLKYLKGIYESQDRPVEKMKALMSPFLLKKSWDPYGGSWKEQLKKLYIKKKSGDDDGEGIISKTFNFIKTSKLLKTISFVVGGATFAWAALGKHSEETREKIRSIWNSFKNFFVDYIYTPFIGWFKEYFGVEGEGFTLIVNSLKALAGKIIDSSIDLTKWMWEVFTKAWNESDFIGKIGLVFSGFYLLQPVMGKIFDFFSSLVLFPLKAIYIYSIFSKLDNSAMLLNTAAQRLLAGAGGKDIIPGAVKTAGSLTLGTAGVAAMTAAVAAGVGYGMYKTYKDPTSVFKDDAAYATGDPPIKARRREIGDGYGPAPGYKPDFSGMNPAFMQRFKLMSDSVGNIPVTSAYRSIEEQTRMYAERQANPSKYPYGVAQPGTSFHNYGMAIDIPAATANKLEKDDKLAKFGFYRPYPVKDPVHIQMSPVSMSKDYDINAIIAKASAKYGVPESIIRGIIQTESNFNALARSKPPENSFGLMQLNSKYDDMWKTQYGVQDYFNPEQNVMAGTAYLASLLKDKRVNGDMNKAISAYNAGAGKIGINPDYIDKVTKNSGMMGTLAWKGTGIPSGTGAESGFGSMLGLMGAGAGLLGGVGAMPPIVDELLGVLASGAMMSMLSSAGLGSTTPTPAQTGDPISDIFGSISKVAPNVMGGKVKGNILNVISNSKDAMKTLKDNMKKNKGEDLRKDVNNMFSDILSTGGDTIPSPVKDMFGMMGISPMDSVKITPSEAKTTPPILSTSGAPEAIRSADKSLAMENAVPTPEIQQAASNAMISGGDSNVAMAGGGSDSSQKSNIPEPSPSILGSSPLMWLICQNSI